MGRTSRTPIKQPLIKITENNENGDLLRKMIEEIQNQMTEMAKQFTDQIAELANQLTEVKKDVTESINVQFANLKDEMKEVVKAEVLTQVQPLQVELQSAIKRIEDLEQKLKIKEEENENLQRAKNVTISGIPLVENENLHEIISAIASKLGSNLPRYQAVKRFPSKDPSKSMISLKFHTTSDKISFMSAYFKIAPQLNLKVITRKAADVTRIYINHDLTKDQYLIHRAAMKMKKDGKVTAVKVINGNIAIFKDTRSKPIFIDTMQKLQLQ